MASVPHGRGEGVHIPHARALVAVLAYGSAALAIFLLATMVRTEDAPSRTAAEPVPASVSADLLARRAVASRAQRGVYVVEGPNGGRGSGFVAWTQEGRNRSYVITARAAVGGVLADGGRSVFLKRGNSFWTGRIVRADKSAGLALIRVDTVLSRPLWQRQVGHGALEPSLPATIVPAGPDAPFGEGRVTRTRGTFRLATGTHELYLGAPVVSPTGRLAGIVVAVGPRSTRMVPIEQACEKIRRCS